MLNIAPRWESDEAVQYSYRWNRTLMSQITCKKTELLEDDANRVNAEKALKENRYETLVFYNHGSANALCGQHRNIIDESNVSLLKGVEVYTMCCLAAKSLGKTAYRKGVKAWWGYTEPFSFIPEDEEIYEYLANLGLLLRHTTAMSWGEIHKQVYNEYTDKINELKDGGNPWTVVTLVNNRNCMVVWCDENPPETGCPFRQAAVNLFGLVGHKMSRTYASALAVNLGLLVLELYRHGGGKWTPLGITCWLGLVSTQAFMFSEYLKALKT